MAQRGTTFCIIELILLAVCGVMTHSHHDSHSHGESPAFKYSKEANQKHSTDEFNIFGIHNVWILSLGSTLLISLAPILILFCVRIDSTEHKRPLLKILLAFASGGLLGDAFLHLIPHSTSSAHHGHSHTAHDHHTPVGLWVLSGIITFLIIEKTVVIFRGSSHSHQHGDGIKTSGYLNLAADFCHNFTDGLAIGASYMKSVPIGIVTTITILVHEIPHEIGDFAILLQSGVSRKSAVMLQITTAIGAMIGTTLSIFLQSNDSPSAALWIQPFTAGGFIYIALVSVMPELLNEDKPKIYETFLQIGALLIGIGLMVLIENFE